MEERIIFDGNHGLTTRMLNADNSGYIGEAVKWEGLASVAITFTLPSQTFAADDNPDWITVNGVPTGTGTITLRKINIHDYEKFLSCISIKGQGVRFGEDLPTRYFSFSADENVSDGSKLKHIFYKVRVNNIPSFNSTTRVNESITNRNIELPITLSPLFYTKSDGSAGRAIYDILSSEIDKARFDKNTGTILFPEEMIEEMIEE